MFEGQVHSVKRINLLYDDVERHYHVITNLTGAMARRYVCKGCNISSRRNVTHTCDQKCSDCVARSPCVFSHFRYPCLECNRHFRIHTCFANNKQSTSKKKSVFERKRCCTEYGWLMTRGNHLCNKRFCDNCEENKEIGYLCYEPSEGRVTLR